MQSRASQLFHQALDLSIDERAELANELLASIDGEAEADVETAWAKELVRRETAR